MPEAILHGEEVLQAYRRFHGNVTQAAKAVGLSRRQVRRILDKMAPDERKRIVKRQTTSLPISHRGNLEDDAQMLYDWLKGKINKTFPIGDACAIINAGKAHLDLVVKELQETGFNVYMDYGQIGLLSDEEPNRKRVVDSSEMDIIRFGALSDTHLGSKAERLDVLHDLYDWYEREGVDLVYHAGNIIEGERRFNTREVYVHGMDNQIANLAEKYPYREGITTKYVCGDDHEGWYQQEVGISIGRHIQHVLGDHGRHDFEYLGYVEADIEHKNNAGSFILRVMHPGGGSAYAISYSVQKIIEGLQGGEKPAMLLAGHYHKLEHLPHIRNVDVIQTGCTTDQSVFLRKKKIDCHIGGWLVEIEQCKKTGAIAMVRAACRKYYDRGFYQDFDRV